MFNNSDKDYNNANCNTVAKKTFARLLKEITCTIKERISEGDYSCKKFNPCVMVSVSVIFPGFQPGVNASPNVDSEEGNSVDKEQI